MTFSLDPEVGVVLAAAFEAAGPPAMPPVGDVDARRAALDPMLEHFNNQAQALPDGVEISDFQVPAADGTELLLAGTDSRRTAVARPCCISMAVA